MEHRSLGIFEATIHPTPMSRKDFCAIHETPVSRSLTRRRVALGRFRKRLDVENAAETGRFATIFSLKIFDMSIFGRWSQRVGGRAVDAAHGHWMPWQATRSFGVRARHRGCVYVPRKVARASLTKATRRNAESSVLLPTFVSATELRVLLRLDYANTMRVLGVRSLGGKYYWKDSCDFEGREFESTSKRKVLLPFDMVAYPLQKFGYEPELVDVEPDWPLLPRDPAAIPVVVVLGHINHGKTTLLDALCGTNVAPHEPGGITQDVRAMTGRVFGDELLAILSWRVPGVSVEDKPTAVFARPLTTGLQGKRQFRSRSAQGAVSAMLFAQNEHHDSQRGKSMATQYFEGDTPEVLQRPWLPGLQEYLRPWWLPCLTAPDAPRVQQIWAARSERLPDDHRLRVDWPGAGDVRGIKDEMTRKGISEDFMDSMDPQKIQTCLSLASLEGPPLPEGQPPGFPLKVKERTQAWSCPCPFASPWGLAEDCDAKKGTRCRAGENFNVARSCPFPVTPEAQNFNLARSCPFPITPEPNQVKAKTAGMSVRSVPQPLPTGRVVRDASEGDHFFPPVVTGGAASETSSMSFRSEKTELRNAEIIKFATKVVSDELIKGKAQASPRTESTDTPREPPKQTWKNKRAKRRGHDTGPKNAVVEYVFQPEHELLEAFQLVPKGIDRGGKQTKLIADKCNGKARFRGRGSRYFEHKGREAPIDLRLCISCPPENFEEGQEQAKRLLAKLQEVFVTRCREKKRWPRQCKTLYTEYIKDETAPGGWIRSDGPALDWKLCHLWDEKQIPVRFCEICP
eukprot:s469_g6.t1